MGQVCVSYYNDGDSNFGDSTHLSHHDEEFLTSLENSLGFEHLRFETVNEVRISPALVKLITCIGIFTILNTRHAEQKYSETSSKKEWHSPGRSS